MEKLTGGTLTPAYKDVGKRADCITLLNAGADMRISTFNFSGLCSIRDLADGMYQVRDRSQRKVWSVTIKSGIAK